LRSSIGERSPKLGVPVVTWGSCGHLSRDFAGVKNQDFLGGRAMCKICAIFNFEEEVFARIYLVLSRARESVGSARATIFS